MKWGDKDILFGGEVAIEFINRVREAMRDLFKAPDDFEKSIYIRLISDKMRAPQG